MINDVSASSITENSAVIIWNTNEISNSSVYYNNLISNENSFILNHSITLSNLNSNTTYYYNVSSCDLVNNCNNSMQFTFTTLTPPNNGGSGGGSGGGGGGGSNPNTQNNIISEENNQVTEENSSISNNKEIETKNSSQQSIKGNESNLTQTTNQKEKSSLVKKLVNIITGKTTLTGKVIDTKGERTSYIAELIAMLSVIALIIYKIFFKAT